jgi:hypothetical protein
MVRRSNKPGAEILTPPLPKQGSSKNGDDLLEMKISMASEGFATTKFWPRLNYKKSNMQIIELSKTLGIPKKFIDMTRGDVLSYLDKCRKLENEDPLHKWIGSYNTKLTVLSRFFKWLHYPDIAGFILLFYVLDAIHKCI